MTRYLTSLPVLCKVELKRWRKGRKDCLLSTLGLHILPGRNLKHSQFIKYLCQNYKHAVFLRYIQLWSWPFPFVFILCVFKWKQRTFKHRWWQTQMCVSSWHTRNAWFVFLAAAVSISKTTGYCPRQTKTTMWLPIWWRTPDLGAMIKAEENI